MDFLPSLTSVPSPSPASRDVVRERCGEQKGHLLAPDGPAGAFRDPGQRVSAVALVLHPQEREGRTGGGGSPHPWGKRREGLPATGAGAIRSYCGSLGRRMISSWR